jgi:hypothetical protein
LSKSCQKNSQKVVKKLSKSCQAVKKLSKSCKKLSKSCQKVQNSTNSVGGVGWRNRSSKVFGISFADRPKAKSILTPVHLTEIGELGPNQRAPSKRQKEKNKNSTLCSRNDSLIILMQSRFLIMSYGVLKPEYSRA